MTKEEFFAVGGTDQHLKDPNFDIVEFMTNFISDDEFESIIEAEVSKSMNFMSRQ